MALNLAAILPPWTRKAAPADSGKEDVSGFLKKRGHRHIRPYRVSFSTRVVLLALLGDILVLLIAFHFAGWARADYGTGSAGYHSHLAGGLFLFLLSMALFGAFDLASLLLYRPIAHALALASLAWLIADPGITLLLNLSGGLSRDVIFRSFILGGCGLLLWRAAFHLSLARSKFARRLRQRILFLGWSEEASRLAAVISGNKRHPYEVVGLLTFESELLIPDPDSTHPALTPMGTEDDLELLLAQDVIDVVIAAGPEATQRSLLKFANMCERWMVDFKIIPTCFQILVSGLNLESVSGIPVLGISRLPLDASLNVLLKWLLDLVGGLVGTVLSLPLIVLFGTLVYLEDPGPIIFGQQRMGRNGRKFRMYKIRTMKIGAESSDQLNQSTLRDDPRLLRIGAFIRRWNIDETPQFWNVLRGAMSLVGPRPERTYHSEVLSTEIPHYNARYNIRPGMTGWAQVTGFRGNTDLIERIKCDLYYIENWSLLLDLQIMVMTLLRNRNAY